MYGREPIDAELQELEELHKYAGTNCGLKRLQQLSKIWKMHADKLRRILIHRARKRDKYAKSLPRYKVGTQVLVRNFTRKPLERKFASGYQIIRILSDNAYKLRKPNGKTFKVNAHHIRYISSYIFLLVLQFTQNEGNIVHPYLWSTSYSHR